MNEYDGDEDRGSRRPALMLVLLTGGPLLASVVMVSAIVWHWDPSRGIATPNVWPLAARRAALFVAIFLSVVPPAAFGLLSRESTAVRILLMTLFGVGGAVFTFAAMLVAFMLLRP